MRPPSLLENADIFAPCAPEQLGPLLYDDGRFDHLQGLQLRDFLSSPDDQNQILGHSNVLYFCFPYICREHIKGHPETDFPEALQRTKMLLQSLSKASPRFEALDVHMVGLTNAPDTDTLQAFAADLPPLNLLSSRSGGFSRLLFPLDSLAARDANLSSENFGSHGTTCPLMMFFTCEGRIEKVFYPIQNPEQASQMVFHWLNAKRPRLAYPLKAPQPAQDEKILHWVREQYFLSNQPGRMSAKAARALLSQSHWAHSRDEKLIATSLAHSDCYGVYTRDEAETLVAMARVVSDRATFAYLCDVFVDHSHQGRGLSRWLLDAIMSQPWIPGVRRFLLFSRDAQGLYRKYGFEKPSDEEVNRLMTWNPL